MQSYTTIKKQAIFRYEDRKSVFFGLACPVSCETDALDFIASVKKEYSDANHHVYAYVLKENSIMRFSDDREPQGTAGMPVLDAIRKNGCCDTVIVVVRYFGGTLLGTGGLVRAYGSAAVGALKDAEIITYDVYCDVSITVSFSDYQKILPVISESEFRRSDTKYTYEVTIIGNIRKPLLEDFLKKIGETLAGRAKIENLGEKFDY